MKNAILKSILTFDVIFIDVASILDGTTVENKGKLILINNQVR